MEIARSRKGILLTLVTIVLLVLMIAELITYVYLKISYENISSFGEVAMGSGELASSLNSGTASFLHASLYSALGALGSYESNTLNRHYVNDTQYALRSLVSNGTVYGSSEMALMGGATLANYTNSVERQALLKGFMLNITNSSIEVHEENPYYINATYRAVAIINSSSGSFAYPITASTTVQLNGSPDIYAVEGGSNRQISLTKDYRGAYVIGNEYALSGSIAPFQFTYGTLIVENGISSCSGIPQRFRNSGYILAIPDDYPIGSCGFGGVVTYNAIGGAYGVPYLVYGSSSNIISILDNGTSLLLSGAGLSLLDISKVHDDVLSNNYYSSGAAPSYLDWSQNNISKKSSYGIYSFGIYNRPVAVFSPSGIKSVGANQALSSTGSGFGVSVWFDSGNQISSYSNAVLVQQLSASGPSFELEIKNSAVVFGSQTPSCGAVNSIQISGIVAQNTWHNIVAVYNSTAPLSYNAYIYLDGVRIGTGGFSMCSSSPSNFIIGGGSGGLNGSMANIQVYNTTLSGYQSARLYYEGIGGIALGKGNLAGWWPLSGNSNDISGRRNNGNVVLYGANSVPYAYMYGYTGDPVHGGSLGFGNITNMVEGAYNCANINSCSDSTLQHLYLGDAGPSGAGGAEALSLGLANAVIPNVGSFNGNGYAFGGLGSYYGNSLSSFSISAWVYVSAAASGPVVDVIGCKVPPGSCSSVPALSIGRNTIYAALPGVNGGSAISYSVANVNTWHNIVLTYSQVSGTEALYVDGANAGSGSGSFTGNGGSVDYWSTSCTGSCTLQAEVASTFAGKMADVQFYNVQLSGAQVGQLFLNDSIVGNAPTDRWPLSIGYNGLMNQSTNTANGLNPAYFADSQGVCTNSNTIGNACGASYSQP
ncbi:MAG: hypothetical protein KGI06_00965 [Candidatus Micrarchaeota archaeon]|nr:hypothetical protein [Candidatus Micrarchaeota archaeon]